MDIVEEVDIGLGQEEVHADRVNDIRKCNPQTMLIDDALGVGNHGRRDDLRLEVSPCINSYDILRVILDGGDDQEENNAQKILVSIPHNACTTQKT